MIKREDQCYQSFKLYLLENGFTTYPCEFDCVSSRHPFVDLAAKVGSFYWAFEYKSASDSISRGLDQVTCYSEWFDYVVLVSERQIDHTTSQIFWDLRKIGVGVWNYFPSSNTCFEQLNPKLQHPDPKKIKSVRSKFRALRRRSRKTKFQAALDRSLSGQLDIADF
jgi:hypothetical protein